MPSPATGYYNGAGDQVLRTTTVISRFKDSGGLVQWAYKKGKEHERLVWQGKEAPANLYAVTEEAAAIGTVVHGLIEKHIKAEPIDMAVYDAMDKRIHSGFDAYLAWEQQTKMRIVAQEVPLVSEQFQFGGRLDAVGEINGKLCLIDWKTSNHVYADYLIQVAAYRQLWNENNPGRQITGPSHLCRFSKEHGDFTHHYFPDLSDAWEAFTLMLRLYRLDRELKKRAA